MLITNDRTMERCHPNMISRMKSSIFILLICILSNTTQAAEQKGGVRESIYRTDLMNKYQKFKSCIYWEARNNKIDELVLMSVILAEFGDEKTSSKNEDGTNDYGIMQINDVRREQVIELGFDPELIKIDGCYNIKVGSRLLAEEIKNANGSLWVAIGRYHYHEQGKYPHNHYKYRARVAAKLQRLVNIATNRKSTY